MSPDENEMKPCPYCGKMTSVHANFCYYCARELVARPERPMPEEKPARFNWLGLALLAVGAAAAVAVLLITGG